MKNFLKKLMRVVLVAVFVAEWGFPTGMTARADASAGHMILPAGAMSLPMIRGMQFDPAEPLNFNFVVDLADQDTITEEAAIKLVRYFLAVVAIPEKDLWVNLSPDGEERIIPDSFGATEAGTDLLSQDLILKQLSASLLHPDQEFGKRFWESVHQKIYETYGLTDMPEDTFQRVWIVPQKAVIEEYKDAAYISESRLKVLVEDDYLAQNQPASAITDEERSTTKDMIKAEIRKTIIPAIEQEVNTGENFALLRQVYHSMILAVWFKTKLKAHALNRVYSNSSKVDGIDLADAQTKDDVFQSYLKIFRDGLYNTIREEYDPATQSMVARKYVSGGIIVGEPENWMSVEPGTGVSNAMLSGKSILLSVAFVALGAASLLAQNVSSDHMVKRPGQLTGLDRPVIEQLQTYVTLNDVIGLNGQVNPVTGKSYSIDTNYIKRNWEHRFDSRTFDWSKEAIVVAAEHKLVNAGHSMVINGHIDQELRDALSQESPTPKPSGAGLNSGSASGGVFASADQVFQQKLAQINDSIPQTHYDRLIQNQRDSLERMKTMAWQVSFDSLSRKVQAQDTIIAQLIADSSRASRPATPPPPPTGGTSQDSIARTGYLGFSFYNDIAGFPAGRKSSGVPFQYGLIGGTYTKGNLNLLANLETGYYLQADTLAGVTGLYVGGTYQLNSQWKLGAQHRFGHQGPNGTVTPVDFLTMDWTGSGYGLSGAMSFTNNFNPDAGAKVRQRAYMMSGYGSFGNLTVTPALYFMPDMMSDWSLNLSYALSPRTTVFLNRNAGAAYAVYNYAPDAFVRMGVNRTLKNGSTLGFYLMNNSYGLPRWKDLGFGTTFKYSWTKGPAATSAVTTDSTLVTTPLTATLYTDISSAGQYGQYSVSRTWKDLAVYSMFETTVISASEGAPMFTNVDWYNQIGFPFAKKGSLTATVNLGLRRNMTGGTNGLTYLRATGAAGSKFSYDYWYSTGTVTDAETGLPENIRGNTFYLTYTPTSWLSIAPTIIVGKQGEKPFQDWGVSVTGTYKNWQASFSYNPVLGALTGTVPDYTRLQVKTPSWTIPGTGTSVQASAYAFVPDRTQPLKGIAPGGTVSIGLGPKPQQPSLGDLLKKQTQDTTTTGVIMKLKQLPDNTPTDTIRVGGQLAGFDVELLSVLKKLTVQDFVDYQTSIEPTSAEWTLSEIEKTARLNFKRLQRDLKRLKTYEGGPVIYTKDLAWGVVVAKHVFGVFGYYKGMIDGDYNNDYRRAAYTFENEKPADGAVGVVPVPTDSGASVVIGRDADKAMVADAKQDKYGGIDLNMDNAQLETRVHETFEGLDRMPDLNLVPEQITGFGVQLIRMVPIFDLSRIFTPVDASPVMISQL